MVGSSRRVRLVATDLDGTLLRDDLTISPRTHESLRAAQRAGIEIVIVTARPPRRIRLLSKALELEGIVICANGALLYDVGSDLALSQSRLASELTCALITRLREALPGVAFAVEAGMSFGCEAAYAIPLEHSEDHEAGLRSDDAADLCREGVTKLIVQHLGYPFDALLAVVRHHAGAHAHVTHSGSDFVEVSAAGVTKAAAVAAYGAERGIRATDVVAVGDMPNDLPMLRWAGWSVAVANAHPHVLAACDARTTSNNDDGVGVLLEELALNDYAMPQRAREPSRDGDSI